MPIVGFERCKIGIILLAALSCLSTFCGSLSFSGFVACLFGICLGLPFPLGLNPMPSHATDLLFLFAFVIYYWVYVSFSRHCPNGPIWLGEVLPLPFLRIVRVGLFNAQSLRFEAVIFNLNG